MRTNQIAFIVIWSHFEELYQLKTAIHRTRISDMRMNNPVIKTKMMIRRRRRTRRRMKCPNASENLFSQINKVRAELTSDHTWANNCKVSWLLHLITKELRHTHTQTISLSLWLIHTQTHRNSHAHIEMLFFLFLFFLSVPFWLFCLTHPHGRW